jgi:quercetin dioxygenase-like cupin family protein
MTAGFVQRTDGGQEIAWLGGSVHRVVLDGAATGGRSALFRSTMRAGTASPVHIHDHDDETVVLLSGSGVFWAGDQRWELEAGDTAFLPRGLPHTYAITSDAAELLTICNPAGMEEFFRAAGWDLARPLPDGWSVDRELLGRAGVAAGQRVLGPPLTPGDEMPEQLRSG